MKGESLRFEKQEMTIYLRIFCNKWFGTCMIGPIYSRKINGAPGNILVPLEIFRAYKDSYSMRTKTILDDDVVRMCPSDFFGCDNIGTKGVRSVHIVHGEPVSD